MNQRKTSELSKIFVSRAGWYSLRYPKKWEIEEDEDSVALFEPEQGVGALHVSAYQTPGDVDPKEEMVGHFSSEPLQAQEITVRINGSTRIASLEKVKDGSFEKTWFISNNGYLVIVTYAAAEGWDKELADAENIIDSIEVEPTLSRN